MLDGTGLEPLQLFSMSSALFVENQGQWGDPSVRYGFDGDGVSIAFRDNELAFQLTGREAAIADGPNDGTPQFVSTLSAARAVRDSVTKSTQFSVRFDGSTDVQPVGQQQADSYFNYFVGDEVSWRSGVPGYQEIVYPGIYAGIDLHTFGRRGSLKYEFHIEPGADYRQIVVSYDGVDGLWIDDAGQLRVQTELGELVDDAPYIYQLIDNQEKEVQGAFALVDDNTYRFEITSAYDPTVELIIDPDVAWSTYLGGSEDDYGSNVAIDEAGNALVTGWTHSSDFEGRSNSRYGDQDAFVAKVGLSGNLVWATYLGGSDFDSGLGIAVDEAGHAFVTGGTGSTDFAGTTNSHHGGDWMASDAFVAKVDTSGMLAWATYLGGGSNENAYDITVADGRALVTGLTFSPDFEGRTNFIHGGSDAFVAMVESSGALGWVTYVGGSGDYESGNGIAVDPWGNPLVTGATDSADFEGQNNAHHGGGSDAFVAKLNGSGLVAWATYLGGGDDDDYGSAITVDGAGNSLVMGTTQSTDFDGRNNSYLGGGSDVFVAKVDSSGSLTWATYLGGSDMDCIDGGGGIVVDDAKNALVMGATDSSDLDGSVNLYGGSRDALIAKIDSAGTLTWAAYVGGSGIELNYGGGGIAIDDRGNAWVTGGTSSTDVEGSNNVHHGGFQDVFVAKLTGVASLEPVDLRVDQYQLTLTPEAGQQRVTARVENVGSDTVNSILVRFRDEHSGQIVADQIVTSLEPLASTVVSALWTPSAVGAVVTVTADPFDVLYERDNRNNSASAIYGGVKPSVMEVTADWDQNTNPRKFGRFVSGVPLSNTFEASVLDPDGASNIDHVEFTLGPTLTYTDTSPIGGWSANLDVGQLAGDETLTVTAYDAQGFASDPWTGTVHVVPFPSWLGSPGDDDVFVDGEYDLNRFFPPQLDITHTIPEDWDIIGGKENVLRLGLEFGVTADLDTSSNVEIDHAFIFEAKVLDVQIFDLSVNPFKFDVIPEVSLEFSAEADGADLSISTIDAELQISEFEIYSGEVPFAAVVIPIGTSGLTVTAEAGLNYGLVLNGGLHLRWETGNDEIQIREGTYIEPVIVGGPYVFGGMGVPAIYTGLELGGEAQLHYRVAYDDINGREDNSWGTFQFYGDLVTTTGFFDVSYRAFAYPDPPWTFGDPPSRLEHANADTWYDETTPDILPWPNLSADAHGNVLLTRVVDLDSDAGEIDPEIFYAMRDATGTWSPLNAVATNGLIEARPDAYFDGLGGAVVAWNANTLDPSSWQTTPWETVLNSQEIYSAYWNGTSWSVPQVVTSDSEADGPPQIVFQNGQGLMVWEHAGGTGAMDFDGYEIYYAVWDSVSKTWSPPLALTNDSEGDWAPTLAFDQSGLAWAVWVHDDDSDPTTAELQYALWTGAFWLPAGTIPISSTLGVREPRLAFDSSGSAHLAWLGSDGTGNVLYTATADHGPWSTPAVIPGTPGFMEGLDFAISNQDEAMLVWHGSDGEHDLFATVRDLTSGNPWTPPARLTDYADEEWLVSTTFDAAGQPLTVWANENVTTVFGEGADGVELDLVPDLTVGELELNSPGMIEGEFATLEVVVANDGWRPADASVVTFYLDDPVAGQVQLGVPVLVSALLPGDTEVVFSNTFALPQGTSEFLAEVTPLPTEIETANNINTVTIEALPPDVTGPLVSVLELQSGNRYRGTGSELTLQFNESVANFTEGDISLVESRLGMVLPDHIYLSPDGQQAKLLFEGGLPIPPAPQYTLRVRSSVTDLAGNALNGGNDAVFQFRPILPYPFDKPVLRLYSQNSFDELPRGTTTVNRHPKLVDEAFRDRLAPQTSFDNDFSDFGGHEFRPEQTSSDRGIAGGGDPDINLRRASIETIFLTPLDWVSVRDLF